MARPTGPGLAPSFFAEHWHASSCAADRAGMGDVQNLRAIGFWRFCTSDRTAEGPDLSPTVVPSPSG
jgi:hypothetical protein